MTADQHLRPRNATTMTDWYGFKTRLDSLMSGRPYSRMVAYSMWNHYWSADRAYAYFTDAK